MWKKQHGSKDGRQSPEDDISPMGMVTPSRPSASSIQVCGQNAYPKGKWAKDTAMKEERKAPHFWLQLLERQGPAGLCYSTGATSCSANPALMLSNLEELSPAEARPASPSHRSSILQMNRWSWGKHCWVPLEQPRGDLVNWIKQLVTRDVADCGPQTGGWGLSSDCRTPFCFVKAHWLYVPPLWELSEIKPAEWRQNKERTFIYIYQDLWRKVA